MQRFADLYRRLDETTQTNRKVAAMRDYFAHVAPDDGALGIYFLCGRRLKRLVMARKVREWCAAAGAIPGWLFDECLDAVGDFAETIALLLPQPTEHSDRPLHYWVEEVLLPLGPADDDAQRELLNFAWSRLSAAERLVFNKLVTGEFRVGVSQRLVVRALAEIANIPPPVVAHRLMGTWEPTPSFFTALLAPDAADTDASRPYPFCLAHSLQSDPETLGELSNWLVEWKWDGIRAQVIRRDGESFIWSRGEELVLHRFPELAGDAARLPQGTVLDGEIVGWKEGQVLPFSDLQRRIGRKNVANKLLAEVPARFIAFDLLERDGSDVRSLPLAERRAALKTLFDSKPDDAHFALSPEIAAASWAELKNIRAMSRERHVEGLMLKRRDSPYSVGRVTGPWWKWKIEPYSCDAVLVYAQRGHGRRASLYTDYTFGAWHEGELVPFAKAYSGLTDEEIHQVDRFVRQNTIDRFGPVRSVKPELVFELAFEGIRLSRRHRSGVAVRFPRMARWRHDKKPQDADSLETIKALLRQPPTRADSATK